MDTSPRLTPTQALLLRAAAYRADGRVIPPARGKLPATDAGHRLAAALGARRDRGLAPSPWPGGGADAQRRRRAGVPHRLTVSRAARGRSSDPTLGVRTSCVPWPSFLSLAVSAAPACKPQTLQTSVCILTVAKRRARASRIGIRPGRTRAVSVGHRSHVRPAIGIEVGEHSRCSPSLFREESPGTGKVAPLLGLRVPTPIRERFCPGTLETRARLGFCVPARPCVPGRKAGSRERTAAPGMLTSDPAGPQSIASGAR